MFLKLKVSKAKTSKLILCDCDKVWSILVDGRSEDLYYFALEEFAAYLPLLENAFGEVRLVDADQMPDELAEVRVADRVILELTLSDVLHFHDAVINAILQTERT